MAKIKLHNPELAANSKFSNLVIENLATDPAISGTVNVGRIWFNSTDKTFKASFLDEAGTGLIIKTFGDSGQTQALVDGLTQEVSDRTAADNTLQGNIDTVASDLATETTNRTNADSTLQGNIDTVSADLATETTNRTNADAAIQAELDNTQLGAGLETDGSYAANGSANYISLATDLKDADNTLDTALKTEETARISADSALDSRVTTVELQVNGKIGDLTTLTTDDKSTIVAAINELHTVQQTKLEAEDLPPIIITYTGLLTNLTTDNQNSLVEAINELDAHADTNAANLATETTNRISADNTLQGNIDAEESARISADNTLQGNIDTLTTDVSTNYLNKTTTTEQTVTANTNFSGDLVIAGNLTVSGTTTTVNTEQMSIADNIITLNSDVSAETAPTENAGIEVNRGSQGTLTALIWDELNDYVSIAENDGSGSFVQRQVATVNYVDGEIANAASDISALETRVTTAEANIVSNDSDIATLQTDLLTEISDRESADTTLQNNINTEATTRANADSTLQGNIDTVSANLATETTNRTNADASIQAELDATQVGAGLGTDGAYTATGTANYIASATSLDNADQTLDTALKTEETARISADNALDTRVTAVESQVNGKIGDLTTLTTDDKSTIVAALNEVDAHTDINSSDIAAEITNRTNVDTLIQAELDSTQTGAGLSNDGTYIVDGLTNYISTATSLANADKLLDTSLKTANDAITSLDTRVTTVEGQVNGKIGDLTTLTTDDKTTVVAAINEVDANIDAEVARATSADATLTSNLNTEISDRTTADNALGVRIDNVNTAAGISGDTYTANASANFINTAVSLVDADNKLDTEIKRYEDQIASTTATTDGTNLIGFEGYTETDTNIVNPTVEIAAGTLKSAIDTIASSVNTRINEFENRFVKGEVAAADKSDTYTIAHNLDTEFVDVSVQVYDEDETVWRFDLVVVEVIDLNTVKISLASGTAAQIRYVIQGY